VDARGLINSRNHAWSKTPSYVWWRWNFRGSRGMRKFSRPCRRREFGWSWRRSKKIGRSWRRKRSSAVPGGASATSAAGGGTSSWLVTLLEYNTS